MAKAAGVQVAPVLIEADATPNPGGWPLGGQTRVDFPNDHLQYAITWFGLALTLLAIYLLFHHSRGRLQFMEIRNASSTLTRPSSHASREPPQAGAENRAEG